MHEVGHLPGLHGPAFLDDDIVLGKLTGDDEVLLDQQHGRFRREPADGLHHGLDDHRREALAGFIDQQQPVVGDQCTRHRQHLLLTAGQMRARQLDQPLQIGEQLEDKVGLAVEIALLALGDFEVLQHAEIAEDAAVLRHEANPK